MKRKRIHVVQLDLFAQFPKHIATLKPKPRIIPSSVSNGPCETEPQLPENLHKILNMAKLASKITFPCQN